MKREISISMLRLTLGAFFLVLGLIGVIPRVQETVFTLNDHLGLEIFFGLVELICGILLVAGLFMTKGRKAIRTASLVVIIFWGLRIFLSKFVWGISFVHQGVLFHPSFATWILVLTAELVILAGLFIVYRAYE
ncbi:MAG TPA: hypothetical protein P5346_14830 [Spirochaetota bacterium]|nr:hypothetical protein [Spirochaetota bacterium]